MTEDEDLVAELEAAMAASPEDVQQPEQGDAPEEVVPQEAAPEEQAPETLDKETDEPDPGDTPQAEEASAELSPPEHWTKERQDAFGSLNDAGKQTLLDIAKDLESGTTKKFQEAAEIRKDYESIADAMKPVEGMLQQAGLSKADGVRHLINAHQQLERDPQAAIEQLLSQYGGDQAAEMVKKMAIKTGLVEAAQDGDADYVDPELMKVRDELNSLKQEITSHQTQTVQQRNHEAANQIRLFSEATDDAGNLLYPHFDKVKAAMGNRIQAAHVQGKELSLEDAYNAETYADPAIRNDLIQAQIAAKAMQSDAERREKNARAQSASKRPARQAPPPSMVSGSKSLEEELEANLVAFTIN